MKRFKLLRKLGQKAKFVALGATVAGASKLSAAADADLVTAITTGTTTMKDTLTDAAPLVLAVVTIGIILGSVIKMMRKAG